MFEVDCLLLLTGHSARGGGGGGEGEGGGGGGGQSGGAGHFPVGHFVLPLDGTESGHEEQTQRHSTVGDDDPIPDLIQPHNHHSNNINQNNSNNNVYISRLCFEARDSTFWVWRNIFFSTMLDNFRAK